mgnify:CR=1 FL=1|tara:strand:+ start:442 stop:636 length:195 start_codon:yes stop_codon:yes gene_type:complete
MIPVEGHKNLYRDEKSGAIINTDSHGFSQYKKSKNIKLTQRQEIDKMKDDIEEIKNLLKQIASK